MIETFAFVLDHVMTALFSCAALAAYLHYRQGRARRDLFVSACFMLLLVLAVNIRDSEVITPAYTFMLTHFMDPSILFRGVLYTALAALVLCALAEHSGRPLRRVIFLVPSAMLIWFVAFCQIRARSPWTSWLFILPVQLFTAGLAVWSLRSFKGAAHARFRAVLVAMIVFSALVLAEDTYVSFIIASGRTAITDLGNNPLRVVPVRNYFECFHYTFLAAAALAAYVPGLCHTAASAAKLPAMGARQAALLSFAAEHTISSRELEILVLLIDGKSNARIAEQLNIAAGTVKAHAHNIFQKVGCGNRNELAACFHRYLAQQHREAGSHEG